MELSPEEKAAWIRETIEDFIDSPENTIANAANDKAWEKPIVGFARGDDPLFDEFKAHIGSFYLTPMEVFSRTFPEVAVWPEELTVISWILPQAKQSKISNRREKLHPSERWARSKKFGELVNVKLRKHLVKILGEGGNQAVAPTLTPFWSLATSERCSYSSTWSERHAAYAAGLGTFGLSDGLITPAGQAMRCGSVIACIEIPQTPRLYTSHHEYCLFYSKGICGVCMLRCPVGAITREGHDKEKCKAHVDGAGAEYARAQYGVDTEACGLCQTKVPCESGIPKMRNRP